MLVLRFCTVSAWQEMNPTPLRALHPIWVDVSCIVTFLLDLVRPQPTNRCLCYFPFCISTKESLQKVYRTCCIALRVKAYQPLCMLLSFFAESRQNILPHPSHLSV